MDPPNPENYMVRKSWWTQDNIISNLSHWSYLTLSYLTDSAFVANSKHLRNRVACNETRVYLRKLPDWCMISSRYYNYGNSYQYTCHGNTLAIYYDINDWNVMNSVTNLSNEYLKFIMVRHHFGPLTEPPTPGHTCWHIPTNDTYSHWYPKYITMLGVISNVLPFPLLGLCPSLCLVGLLTCGSKTCHITESNYPESRVTFLLVSF